MSFLTGGGGGSGKNPPKLLQVNPQTAETAAVGQDITAEQNALAFQKQRQPLVFAGRNAEFTNALGETGPGTGMIGPFAQGALDTAGLEGQQISAPGNTFQEAINLGEPLVAPEQRDRNYVENLLNQNPEVFKGLDPSAVLQIALGNLGNVNSAALSNFQTRQNAYLSQVGQNAQNIAAGGQLATGITRAFNQPSPYTNPFFYNYVYGGGAPYFFGTDTAPIPEGVDLAQYGA